MIQQIFRNIKNVEVNIANHSHSVFRNIMVYMFNVALCSFHFCHQQKTDDNTKTMNNENITQSLINHPAFQLSQYYSSRNNYRNQEIRQERPKERHRSNKTRVSYSVHQLPMFPCLTLQKIFKNNTENSWNRIVPFHYGVQNLTELITY